MVEPLTRTTTYPLLLGPSLFIYIALPFGQKAPGLLREMCGGGERSVDKRTQKISIPYRREVLGQLLGARGVFAAHSLSILRQQTWGQADLGGVASSLSSLVQTS